MSQDNDDGLPPEPTTDDLRRQFEAEAEEQSRESDIEMILLRSRDLDPRSPLLSEVEFVLRQLPAAVLEVLETRQVVVFAPRRLGRGRAVWFPGKMPAWHMVYLSPSLLDRTTDYVRFVTAHELAHVYLDHRDVPTPGATPEMFQRDEAAADALAAQWGFPRPG